MGFGRALVFASVTVLPAFVAGLSLWILFGGSESWQDWQYLTCYAVPGALIMSAFIMGYRGSSEVEQ
ncbi:MAG: hypothetical protein CBD52_003555 [Euryarchaeota archaeon TMED192]|nr:MAG: hypothetical protein CBD52_005405 [Euryarchaeota archaeon TMED192]RPG71918.1 MAG: hypothetical protein CBD52_003555 [Euryarchaeota archaeon TMED192]